MLLILSGRAVNEDIAQQFGRLPPSFLPLGRARLFSIQAEVALGEPCFMTVPECFELSAIDRADLQAAGIVLVPQPAGLRLPEAIGHALARIAPEGPLRLLYGDTMVRMPEQTLCASDIVAVQGTTANYPWAFVTTAPDGTLEISDDPPSRLDTRRVVCGYFTFADPELLARACEEATIVSALRYYNAHRTLSCVEAEAWFDFGHLPLLFQSKKDIQVKRVFNELVYEDHMLIKRSADTAKIRAEAHWYENLPAPLRLHAPRYGGRIERDHKAGYGVEYLYAPLLSDLSVFGALPLASWLEIVSACLEFVTKCQAIRPPEGAPEASDAFAAHFFQSMIVDKTWSRLAAYCAQSGISLDDRIEINGTVHPPLRDVVEGLIARVPPTRPDHIRFWHGDLFFGNMFYDFTARRVMCIDPRGQLATGEFCLYGDLRYDLAKLAHSTLGQYDKILLGRSRLWEIGPRRWRFEIEEHDEHATLADIYTGFVTETCGVGRDELRALTALLFLSMLPLHHDQPDLQRHFLATGLTLAARGDRRAAA